MDLDKKPANYMLKTYHKNYPYLCSQPLHRIVYQLFKGPIPEGYEIDHID